MTLQELLNDSYLTLPKAIPQGATYRSYIDTLLDGYITLMKSISPVTTRIKGVRPLNKMSNVIRIQEDFIKGIKDTLLIYFDGQPAKAYMKFADVLETRRGKIRNFLNIGSFEKDGNFYRIRKKTENFPLGSLEMFHIPFHNRGKVSTQRYSIPGYPSLYLGKTLYVAWEEMKRPNLDTFQAVRLVLKKQVTYLDLTKPDWGGDLNKTAYKYLMTWPLIAACSIKVANYDDPFKPEYILPQLLLQWVRNTSPVDGIKYGSTHIDTTELAQLGDLYNLVFPVKENCEKGYCSQLMGLFEITETVSKQLLDYSSGGGTFLYTKKEIDSISAKIPALEIVKGRKFPYGYSALGKMELTLDSMKTKPIEVDSRV